MGEKRNREGMTQRELARRLGVSQMTVSRALNGRDGVSTRLRKRILEASRRAGYVRDRVAASLRVRATHTIGLVVPDVSDGFYPDITAGIEEAASREGYRIILSHSHWSYREECDNVDLLRGFRIDGLIIAPAGAENDTALYAMLEEQGIPFVFIDRAKEKVDCSYVATDVASGTLQLGRYLLNRGYEKWGYLSGPTGFSTSEDHFKGLQQSLAEAGRDTSRILSVQAGMTQSDGYKAAGVLLQSAQPDVIIGVNDPVAVGAYRHLREKNIRVPEDVAVAGFSDLKSMDILEVPLTTVREPTAEIGRQAVSVLLHEIAHPDAEKQRVRLMPELVVRRSA